MLSYFRYDCLVLWSIECLQLLIDYSPSFINILLVKSPLFGPGAEDSFFVIWFILACLDVLRRQEGLWLGLEFVKRKP